MKQSLKNFTGKYKLSGVERISVPEAIITGDAWKIEVLNQLDDKTLDNIICNYSVEPTEDKMNECIAKILDKTSKYTYEELTSCEFYELYDELTELNINDISRDELIQMIFNHQFKSNYRDGLAFILDGKTYAVFEEVDMSNGELLSDVYDNDFIPKVTNTFEPQRVFGKYYNDERCGSKEYLKLIDSSTKKDVIKIGWDTDDSWYDYPYTVMDFNPENMKINATK